MEASSEMTSGFLSVHSSWDGRNSGCTLQGALGVTHRRWGHQETTWSHSQRMLPSSPSVMKGQEGPVIWLSGERLPSWLIAWVYSLGSTCWKGFMQVVLWPPYMHCDMFVCVHVYRYNKHCSVFNLGAIWKGSLKARLLGQLWQDNHRMDGLNNRHFLMALEVRGFQLGSGLSPLCVPVTFLLPFWPILSLVTSSKTNFLVTLRFRTWIRELEVDVVQQ